MLRVALIGCGLIADQHVSQIHRIPGCELVAVCDREPLMARQLADRFRVERWFSELNEMLETVRPQVVHITTPAQSHYPLGKRCLESGCHVYIEKPFTVLAEETETLLKLAETKGLLVTAGHNLQFNPEAIRMRELVQSGFLGGPPVHMDCVQCFSHDDPTYSKALLGDRRHWVRTLPGSLLHNLISHGIAKIAEFMPGEQPKVNATVFSSPFLRSIGQEDVVDEVRAVIHDGANTTAVFAFSTQLGAGTNQISVYGKQATLVADSTNRTLISIPQAGFKSYLRFFLAPRVYARKYRQNSWANIRQFLKNDFHMDYGMKVLMEHFYRAIDGRGPLPISYREILMTARIMERIFESIPRNDGEFENFGLKNPDHRCAPRHPQVSQQRRG
jgi:predicted dehydrogenase